MSRKAVLDVVERTAATFAVSFLAAFNFTGLSTWHDVGVAAAAAALSALKSTAVNLYRK